MTSLLITGNTGLLTQELLDTLAGEYRVVVTVDERHAEAAGREGNLHLYRTSPLEEAFAQLFDAYRFECVLYLSSYADGGDGFAGEHKWLERVFDRCAALYVGKFVLLSTTESRNFTAQLGRNGELLGRQYASPAAFGAGQVEDWCAYLAGQSEVKLITLWCPCLAGQGSEEQLLGRLFAQLAAGGEVRLPGPAAGAADFLSMKDLGRLMLQILQETEDPAASYYAVSGYHHTWGEVASALQALRPEASFAFAPACGQAALPDYPHALRKTYGFIPLDDVPGDFAQFYHAYLAVLRERQRGRWQRARARLGSALKGALKYLELGLVFVLAELLAGVTSSSVYFKVIDVRLLFIVMMSMLYGLRLGVLAAVLECGVLAWQYARAGMDAVVLFYNIENWIPFVFYLMTGSVVGYLVDKRANEMSFAEKELELLRGKYGFLNRVYQGVLENRGEYRRQILGFQDSFGKIFEAVQRLDSESTGTVMMKGLQVMEEVLHNHTIAIYTLDGWQRFGRLAVCSNSMLTRLTKSLRIAEMQQVYDAALQGEVYRNTSFEAGLPAYAYGIAHGGKLAFLVLIWEVSPEQYGIYYMNLFRILCGLMQTSFLRALEYEELRRAETYYPGTQIARPEHFRKGLQIQEDMRAAGVSDYVLVKFHSRDRAALTEKLTGMIRATDLLGADADENLYLVLTQTRAEHFGVVARRLDERGIGYELAEGVG